MSDWQESLLSYVEAVQGGVRGLVTNSAGDTVSNAIIEVDGINKNVTTSYFGEFWRLLGPGQYWSVCITALHCWWKWSPGRHS